MRKSRLTTPFWRLACGASRALVVAAVLVSGSTGPLVMAAAVADPNAGAAEAEVQEAGAQEATAEHATAEEATAEDEMEDEPEFSDEVEKLLTESSEEVDYAVSERCIQVRSIRDTDILDDRHIVFETAGKKLYLVQFKRRCYDLRPSSTLFFEPRGNRLCQLDTIRASRSFGIGPPDMGIPCPIPGFIAITPEQVALLRESLKARRKAPSAPPPAPEPEDQEEEPDAAG